MRERSEMRTRGGSRDGFSQLREQIGGALFGLQSRRVCVCEMGRGNKKCHLLRRRQARVLQNMPHEREREKRFRREASQVAELYERFQANLAQRRKTAFGGFLATRINKQMNFRSPLYKYLKYLHVPHA
jgi:hypothetical protein